MESFEARRPVTSQLLWGIKRFKMTITYFMCRGLNLALLTAAAVLRGADSGSTQKLAPIVPMRTVVVAPALPSAATNPPAAMEIIAPATLPASVLAFDADLKEATVKAGEAQAYYAFNLTNVSAGKVIISSIASACGCTTTRTPPLPWTLGPGTNGQISLTLNVAGHTNELFRAVSVNTDKGAKTLVVKATILPPPAYGAPTNSALPGGVAAPAKAAATPDRGAR